MIKHKRSQIGFGVVEALCFLVMFSMVGLIGWYVINENQNSQATLDNIGGAEVQTKSVEGTKVGEKFVFQNLGVAIVLPDTLKGLQYKVYTDNGNPSPAGEVSMKDLLEEIKSCDSSSGTSNEEYFAFLSKEDGVYAPREAASVESLKQFDGFYISMGVPNRSGCRTDSDAKKIDELDQKYTSALKEAFKTATLVE